jgi:hypothetical protein
MYTSIYQIFPLELWSDIIAYLGYLTIDKYFFYKKAFGISDTDASKIFFRLKFVKCKLRFSTEDFSNLPKKLTHIKTAETKFQMQFITTVAPTIKVIEFRNESLAKEFFKNYQIVSYPNLLTVKMNSYLYPFDDAQFGQLNIEVLCKRKNIGLHHEGMVCKLDSNIFCLNFKKCVIDSMYHFENFFPKLQTFNIKSATIKSDSLITLPETVTDLNIGDKIKREFDYYTHTEHCIILIENLKNLTRIKLCTEGTFLKFTTCDFKKFANLRHIYFENLTVDDQITYPENLIELSFNNCKCSNNNFLQELPKKLSKLVCILVLISELDPNDFEIVFPPNLLHLDFKMEIKERYHTRPANIGDQMVGFFHYPIQTITYRLPACAFWPKNFNKNIPKSLTKLELFEDKKYNSLNNIGKRLREDLINPTDKGYGGVNFSRCYHSEQFDLDEPYLDKLDLGKTCSAKPEPDQFARAKLLKKMEEFYLPGQIPKSKFSKKKYDRR